MLNAVVPDGLVLLAVHLGLARSRANGTLSACNCCVHCAAQKFGLLLFLPFSSHCWPLYILSFRLSSCKYLQKAEYVIITYDRNEFLLY